MKEVKDIGLVLCLVTDESDHCSSLSYNVFKGVNELCISFHSIYIIYL